MTGFPQQMLEAERAEFLPVGPHRFDDAVGIEDQQIARAELERLLVVGLGAQT